MVEEVLKKGIKCIVIASRNHQTCSLLLIWRFNNIKSKSEFGARPVWTPLDFVTSNIIPIINSKSF